MKTKKQPISENTLAFQYLPANYSDSFECRFTSTKEITADDVLISFWTNFPKWVEFLFKLRNVLVKPFKIESDKSIDKLSQSIKECISEGKAFDFMSVVSKSENETILCVDDKHLKFYISVLVDKDAKHNQSITASTIVKYHNFLGRCYFIVISPFHNIIVKNMIKYIVKKKYI